MARKALRTAKPLRHCKRLRTERWIRKESEQEPQLNNESLADRDQPQDQPVSGIAGEPQILDVIESLPTGFLLCDADDRVVAFNRLFLEWFFKGIEHEVTPGRPYREILDVFANSPLATPLFKDRQWKRERVKRRLDPGISSEHHLGDGRIVRTQEKRTRDGGIVSIYSDITSLSAQQRALEEKSAQLQIVLEAIDQGISFMDAGLICRAHNKKFLDLLEFPAELGEPDTPFDAFIRYNAERGEYGDGDVDEQVRERVELAKQFEPHSFERTRPDGTIIQISGNPLASGGFVTTYTDITEQKQAELGLRKRDQELTEQVERFNAALSNMSQGLCMFDKDKNLVVCNDRYIELYELTPELSQPGTPFRRIIEHRIERGIYCEDPEAYIVERLASVEEQTVSTKIQELTNGRVVAIVHQPMANGGWVATHEDITELQRIQARVAYMAHHDALTDLANRSLLRNRLEEAVPALKRGEKFAVLCLDLDRFKSVNDGLGHPIGDQLLAVAAERLQACARSSDTVARLGGDEFAILQGSVSDPKETISLATRICESLSTPFHIGDHQIVIGTSIGIAMAPTDGIDPDRLLKHADMALYRAKADGRGVYRFFEPEMDARMQVRRRLELDLRNALDHDEFELHYQPLVNLETDTISGFEALARWRHPDRGLVSPAEFIPVAEETGLIVPLGEWVVREACRAAVTWPKNVRVSVNLSPAQFRGDDLARKVFSALANSGLAPGRLELEITESALLEDNDSTLTTLHALRDMGIRIAMDDFGTGYSSLSYLRSFPFDKIKIDGSFVRDLSGSADASAIVNAVATLSQSLGMTTTAEGVETEAQRQLVKEAGYTEMQGYLFSRPRPGSEIAEEFFGQSRKKQA